MSKSDKVIKAKFERFETSPIEIQHAAGVLHARPLTGSEVMRLADISQGVTDSEAIGLFAFIAAHCMINEFGDPLYQGEKDIEKAKQLPFSMLRAVAEACLEECGLEDDDMFSKAPK